MTDLEPDPIPSEFYRQDAEREDKQRREHWANFTPEQQAKIEANTPPWILSSAIYGTRFSWWWETKNRFLQWLSNLLKGIR